VSALLPDDYRAHLAGKVRAHRLAQAARANPAPVFLQTGHFAPPNAYAVWHLVTSAGNVLQVVARQGDREITCRIVPEGEA
jgi:hypothetical protein